MRRLIPALALGAASAAAPQSPPALAPPIARIAYVDERVELQRGGKDWADVKEGAELRIGDRLRTGPRSTARIDFPWMSIALGGSSQLAVPPSLVLSTVLEEGRVEQTAPTGEIVKLLTDEARIRGEGRVAVRRARGRTLVSALAGSFSVEAKGKLVTLAAGEGTIVMAGAAPQPPRPLPAAPGDLDPGDDPLYVVPKESVTLRFSSKARAHHLQVLGIDSSQVLIARDIAGSPTTLQIPWEGTYRWRVAARDADGLEGLPSREGLITAVAK